MDIAYKMWRSKLASFEQEAHEILGSVEGSKSRVVSLNATRATLDASSTEVRDSFEEAVGCLEFGLNRSAIIVSWNGFFYQFCESFIAAKGATLKGYNNWKINDLAELLEKGDAEILVAAHRLKFLNHSLLRSLDGHLATRNRCAHPSGFRPTQNQTIGFVDEMITQAKHYHSSST